MTAKLKVGDRGYIFDHGNYHPARIVCDDLIQTFGPVDQIAAYSKTDYASHEFTTRLTDGYNPCNGLSWVSDERFKEIEREKIDRELDALQARSERIR